MHVRSFVVFTPLSLLLLLEGLPRGRAYGQDTLPIEIPAPEFGLLAGRFAFGYCWRYHATVECEEDGRLEVRIAATDFYGLSKEIRAVYDIGMIDHLSPLDWSSNDGVIHITAPSEVVMTGGLLLVERDTIQTSFEFSRGDMMEPISDLFRIDLNYVLSTEPALTIHYTEIECPDVPSARFDVRKIGIYKKSVNEWEYVAGQGICSAVTGEADLPGEYASFYNPEREVVPAATMLFQNYPNPFHPATTIAFDLHSAGRVELTIYNVAEKRVRKLVDGFRNSGLFEDK
jgi:hypothetical protein